MSEEITEHKGVSIFLKSEAENIVMFVLVDESVRFYVALYEEIDDNILNNKFLETDAVRKGSKNSEWYNYSSKLDRLVENSETIVINQEEMTESELKFLILNFTEICPEFFI